MFVELGVRRAGKVEHRVDSRGGLIYSITGEEVGGHRIGGRELALQSRKRSAHDAMRNVPPGELESKNVADRARAAEERNPA